MLFLFFIVSHAIEYGSLKKNDLLSFPIFENSIEQKTSLVLDANWHWVHDSQGQNCYTNSWVKDKGCFLEGVPKDEWAIPYGVTKIDKKLKLSYVTKGPYSTNIGSRLYLIEDNRYKFFDLNNAEFSFTVDLSSVPCGLNAAVYFVAMPDVDAQMGLGYCDAQCPEDIKYINGVPNIKKIRQCCRELDVAEMNSKGFQMAVHSCSKEGVCEGEECGIGSDRYKGICDKDGNDLNYFRNGITLGLDTKKPFTIVTKFSRDEIIQDFIQDGVYIKGGILNDVRSKAQKKNYKEQENARGGLQAYDLSKQVLVLSLWDDSTSNMKWLDSSLGTGPGSKRGPCTGQQDPEYLRKTYPQANVIFSDFKFVKITEEPKEPDSIKPKSFIILNCSYV